MYGKFKASGPVNLDSIIREGNTSECRYVMSQVAGLQLAKDCLHLPESAELEVWLSPIGSKNRQTAHPLRLSQIRLAYKRDIPNPIWKSQGMN